MSSSSTSSSSSILAASSTTKPFQFLSPIQHLITIKLNRDNYLLWKAQISPYFKGQHLFGFLDGTQPAPPQLLPPTSDASSQSTLNPEYIIWHSQDQMILSALISSISETILAYVVKCATSHDVWTTLERMFISQSQARSMSIHYQLATLRKGDSSISDYFHQFTHLVDTLVAIAQLLPLHESLSFLLAGLGSDYDSLVTSVQTQINPISLEDIYGHLLSHELRLSHNQPSVDLSVASANFVHKGSSPRGGRGGRSTFSFLGRNGFNSQRGRGHGRSHFPPASSRPVCQVCHKPRHVALQCYHRFDNTYQFDNSPQMHALLATPQQTQDSN